jgi:hypothetical protein
MALPEVLSLAPKDYKPLKINYKNKKEKGEQTKQEKQKKTKTKTKKRTKRSSFPSPANHSYFSLQAFLPASLSIPIIWKSSD